MFSPAAVTSLAFGDFNGDGKEDVIVGLLNAASAVGVFFGNGDGTLQPANVNSVFSGYAGQPLLVGDFNGDGKADLVLDGYILLGNGDGTFTESTYVGTSGGIALGDLNGDGATDIVSTGYLTVSVNLGNGVGTFANSQNYPIGFSPTSLATADINGDGKLDVIATSSSSGSMAILFGNGDGTLQSAVAYSLGLTPTQIAVGEFNGDGRTDLAFAVGSSNSVDLLVGVLTPVLSIASFHGANFYVGETGATYSITVTNDGPGVTNGTISMVDSIPSGLTPTAIGGVGWACVLGTVTCTRSDSLAVGSSYPAITVTVNVSLAATSPVVNLVTASGGGSVPASGVDSTIIGTLPPPGLISPTSGAAGVSTTASLSWNASTGATSYDVYFGTSSAPPFIVNTTATTYSPGTACSRRQSITGTSLLEMHPGLRLQRRGPSPHRDSLQAHYSSIRCLPAAWSILEARLRGLMESRPSPGRPSHPGRL